MRQNRENGGFSVAEILVAIALLGVIAMMVVPKILYANEDKVMTASIRETFVAVGEMYQARKNNANYPLEDANNERVNFGRYIYEHTNTFSAVNPANNPDYCPGAGANLFVLPTQAVIRKICDVGTTLQISIQVPTGQQNVTKSFIMVIPKNSNRYTTLYGSTGTCADWTDADRILNIQATKPCP